MFKSIPVDSVDRPAKTHNQLCSCHNPQPFSGPSTPALQLLNFILRAAAFFVCCLCVSVRACARVCAGSTTLRATHNTSCCASHTECCLAAAAKQCGANPSVCVRALPVATHQGERVCIVVYHSIVCGDAQGWQPWRTMTMVRERVACACMCCLHHAFFCCRNCSCVLGGCVAPGLTFEDLAIDDTLDDLGRVSTYCKSRFALQR